MAGFRIADACRQQTELEITVRVTCARDDDDDDEDGVI